MLGPPSDHTDARSFAPGMAPPARPQPALKPVGSGARRVAIAGVLGMVTVLCGCANDVSAHDPGDYRFRGTWRESSRIGTAVVWGREYSARFTFGQRDEIVFTSSGGDPIVCVPNRPNNSTMTGSCTVNGRPAYRLEFHQGYTHVPWIFTLSPNEKRASRAYKGKFKHLTNELSLDVDGVAYAGKINGRLRSPGDAGEGLLYSPEGKSMPCYLHVSPVGGGYGYCAPYPGVRYDLYWRQGRHP